MKTILFLYHVASIGGGSYCLLNMLIELDRAKYRPVVLLGQNGPLIDEIKKQNIEVYVFSLLHIVPYNRSALTPQNIVNALKIIISNIKYRRLLKNISPHIVYVNTMMLYPYLRCAKNLNIKTIIHIREHWEENEHRIQRKIAVNHIKKYADKVVAINNYSASIVENHKNKVEIVYDWIDLSKRYKEIPMEHIFNEDCSHLKIYLFLGGLQPIKGINEVVQAFTSIQDSNVRLLIMGVNSSLLSKGFKGTIKSVLGKFGYKTYSGKIMDLINSDNRIRCMPSIYEITHIIEQSYCVLSYFTIPHANLALAEGIILKTITIAAETQESLEYSYNGNLAVLFKINNKEDFYDKICKLNSQYQEIKKRLKSDSFHIEKMFDRTTNAEKLDKIFEELLS